MLHGVHDVAGACFTFGADHGRAFGDAAQGFAEVARSADEGSGEGVLVDVVRLVGGGEDFALVNIINAQLLQNLCLGGMADAGLGHDGDGNSLNDLLDERGARHAGHAAFGADHGGDALESHDGCGAGLFGDASLLDGHDVHDDAALEHLGQADFEAQAGAGETVIFCRFRHLFGPRRAADSARGGMKSRKVFPTLSVAAK